MGLMQNTINEEYQPDPELEFIARGGVSDEETCLESLGMLSLMGLAVKGDLIPFRSIMASGVMCTMDEATEDVTDRLNCESSTALEIGEALTRWILSYVGASQYSVMEQVLKGHYLDVQGMISQLPLELRRQVARNVSFNLAWSNPALIEGVDFDALPDSLPW